jgi:hypothetical protein
MIPKRKKRKRKKPENESYEIEVRGWEVYFHFGIKLRPTLMNKARKKWKSHSLVW